MLDLSWCINAAGALKLDTSFKKPQILLLEPTVFFNLLTSIVLFLSTFFFFFWSHDILGLDIRDNSLEPLFISSIQDKGFAENYEYTDPYEKWGHEATSLIQQHLMQNLVWALRNAL